MALTTVQQIQDALSQGQHRQFSKLAVVGAKQAGSFMSTWMVPGMPGAGAASPAFNAGSGYTCDKSTPGSFPYVNAVTQNYLARISAINGSVNAGTLILADRLWSCSGMGFAAGTYTVTTPGSLPARITDNGLNCELYVEQMANAGAASGTLTANYLDSAAGAQAGLVSAVLSTPSTGHTQLVQLANGLGVKQLTSVVTSATWTSGTFGMTILKRLVEIPLGSSLAIHESPRNLDWAGVLQKIPNDACLMLLWLASGTGVPQIIGSIDIIDV